MGLPQYWLHRRGQVRHGAARGDRRAARRQHRHSHPCQLGPVGDAAGRRRRPRPCSRPASATCATRACCCAARTTRPEQLLDLCFALLDDAKIMPYYFYMCDMIPNAEHWRLSLAEAQHLQHDIMGYLPGFATPRFICDVPYVGKRWVHQVAGTTRSCGISYWTKNYRTGVELRRRAGAAARVRVLRPDLPAARGRPGVLAFAGQDARSPRRRRLAGPAARPISARPTRNGLEAEPRPASGSLCIPQLDRVGIDLTVDPGRVPQRRAMGGSLWPCRSRMETSPAAASAAPMIAW